MILFVQQSAIEKPVTPCRTRQENCGENIDPKKNGDAVFIDNGIVIS